MFRTPQRSVISFHEPCSQLLRAVVDSRRFAETTPITGVVAGEFPSMKAKDLLRVLMRQPLGYRIIRQRGSHRILVSDQGYPKLLFAFHIRQTIPAPLVRRILVHDVGLVESEVRELR